MTDALTRKSPGRTEPGAGPARPGFWLGLLRVKELSILLVTIAAAIYFSLTSGPGFATSDNYHTIAQYVAPWAIVGAGEVLVLICGQIDLSAGFVFTLSPFVLMLFYNNGFPLFLALIGSVVVSALIGMVNGLIHTIFGLSAFITTLGMAFLLWGLSLIISGGSPVSAPTGNWVSSTFGGWGWSEFLWALVVVAVVQTVLSTTRFGIATQATGGNPVGAAESGIRTGRVKVICFAITGGLAGFAGILQGTRVGSYDPTNGGFNTMFYAVAAAVIGGTALLGGSGTVIGAFLGALLLGLVYDGFNLTGISANAFYMVLGCAILIAALLNVYVSVIRKRLGRQ
ncbi:simple sugar transport system permease protein [Amycolatopsis bartoniae]|uniref:Sugar ABC transporter permease n=1 Tax=Amycolatopsis bartoniae TaxID=941986 RepID=A0A8H9J6X2_9PSEU|nr:ABC transporter permease [Amycolatopsis bartoniae]MBB2935363.1 simple sugar transport system permease protein [Amycolatopsis bartoniae]TVS99816.1 ABC transporter permease [Amycolatopsis bartoniae]GHF85522.1 sugar ABC transporter permease [Amycolatopsis bartoniae]